MPGVTGQGGMAVGAGTVAAAGAAAGGVGVPAGVGARAGAGVTRAGVPAGVGVQAGSGFPAGAGPGARVFVSASRTDIRGSRSGGIGGNPIPPARNWT